MPFTLADRPLVRTSPRTMLSGPPNVFAFLLRGPAADPGPLAVRRTAPDSGLTRVSSIRLCDLHHRACVAARPDPEALAARLFEWELHSRCSLRSAWRHRGENGEVYFASTELAVPSVPTDPNRACHPRPSRSADEAPRRRTGRWRRSERDRPSERSVDRLMDRRTRRLRCRRVLSSRTRIVGRRPGSTPREFHPGRARRSPTR